jgi:hypothetical protein
MYQFKVLMQTKGNFDSHLASMQNDMPLLEDSSAVLYEAK